MTVKLHPKYNFGTSANRGWKADKCTNQAAWQTLWLLYFLSIIGRLEYSKIIQRLQTKGCKPQAINQTKMQTGNQAI